MRKCILSLDGSELGFPTRQSAEHSSRADVIRQITIQPHLVEEAIKITAQVFLPVLRKEPGFLDFYSILVSEHEAVSVSLFETKEQAEAGNNKALEWAREQLFSLALGPAEMLGAGEVVLHREMDIALSAQQHNSGSRVGRGKS